MVTFPGVRGRNTVLLFFPQMEPMDPTAGVAVFEPISVITLAGHLMQKGFPVEIFDSRTRNDIDEALARCNDDLLCVGISAMAGYQVVDGYNFSKRVKEAFPHIPVVWGGWYPTVSPGQCLESPYIDLVVKGQGEERLPAVADRLKTEAPVSDIVGISYKLNGNVIHNPIPLVASPAT